MAGNIVLVDEMMEKRSKGGFFGLFDWHSKSKKKLFANSSESNEQSNKGREVEEISVQSSRDHLATGVEGFGLNVTHRGSSDFSSSSSVTSDEAGGNKVPGLVAKLMGLDSLPTSNVVEPYSTLHSEPRSFRASHYERSTPNLWGDYHPTDYLMISNEGPSWNPAEPRLHKAKNRPIDRFQSEVLPPKSAKPISITHHRLLSPIKSSGFIHTHNTAYIIEAAAKMIEPSPQASRNNRIPSIGSSSVPLRIRDLKEKAEAVNRTSRAQTTKEPISNREKSYNRSRSGSSYPAAIKASTDLEKRSFERSRVKGKAASFAVQSKSNVQRREGVMSSRNLVNEERYRLKPNRHLRGVPNIQKTEQKRNSANRNSNVLGQNNQRQNGASCKDKSVLKASVLVQPTRKSHSANGSAGTNKIVKKVVVNSDLGSKTTSSASTGTHISSSKQKNFSRRKCSVAGDCHSGECIADNVITNKVERSIKSNASGGGTSCNSSSSDGKNTGMDIVSFTFTSPIKRSAPECNSSGQDMVEASSKSLSIDFSADKGRSQLKESESSSGANMINGDALSILLEQKLKELVDKVESSSCNLVNAENSESSAYSTTTEVSPSYAVNSSLGAYIDIKGSELDLPVDVSDCMDNESSLTSQELVERDAFSSDCKNAGTEEDLSYPSPISNRLFSVAVGDCSINGDIAEGNKLGTLSQVHEDFSCLSIDDHRTVICETEVPDSAYLPPGDELRNHICTITDTNRSCNWELEYVRNIINSAELTLEDFMIGLEPNVISQDLFNRFENQESGAERYGGEYMKVTRKVLFDCVGECFAAKFGQTHVGSCKAFDKWSTLYREGLLAEELYQEIIIWVSMGDLMVDELVDKDMSSRHGRWLYFDLETLEGGVEIEEDILNNLVTELVTDLYF